MAGIVALHLAAPVEAQAWAEWRSLGVPVVESGSADGGSQEWSLAGPRLTLGLIEGPASQLFTHIWDAERAVDGRIVLVEASSHEIRVFAADGQHLATFGGMGDGPEEFGGPPWISVDGDVIRVWDPGHFRRSTYSFEGDLLEQVTLRDEASEAGITPFPDGLVWETSRAGQLWTGSVGTRPREGPNLRLKRLVWLTPDSVEDLGTFRSGRTHLVETRGGGFRGIGDLFAPSSVAAVSPEGLIAISEGEVSEILILGADRAPLRLLAPAIPRRPVESSGLREYRSRLPGIAAQLGVSRQRLEQVHASIPVPDSVPAIGDLAWSQDGSLWVGRRVGEARTVDEYHVLAPDGGWLARVRLPEDVDAVMDVGHDHLLARRRDELGVQYLDLYSIMR